MHLKTYVINDRKRYLSWNIKCYLLTIYWYAQTNNKYVKDYDYDKNKKSSYLKYLSIWT